MMLKTHLLSGFLVGLLFVGYFGAENKVLFLLVVVFSSALADIDLLNSSISRRLEPFARLASLFKHRSLMHSIAVPAILYIVFFAFDREIALAVLVGYLSHIFLDAFTAKGVRILYPLRFRIKGFMKTGGFAEYVLLVVLFAAISYYIFHWTLD